MINSEFIKYNIIYRIRAIESDVRRLKGTSDSIIGELKKQKDSTTALQNEFKWLHNEIKAVRKSLSDIELLVNQTVRNDTEFIREKITDLNNFIFKIGKVEPVAKAKSTNINGTATTVSPITTSTTKRFKLF